MLMDAAAELVARREDGEAEGVHRLRDIVVEEVSLVDRAANKRRFLVVKRSDDMADESSADTDVEKAKKKPAAADASDPADERKKPGAGETDDAEKARKPPAADEDDEEDTAKAAAPSEEEEPAGAKKTPKRKQALAVAAPVKDALLRAITVALERLMALANSIKDATEPDEGDDATMPEEVGNELAAIAELLGSIDKRKATKAAVAKTGARMSKDRLDRFQKAMAALADILKELTDSKDVPAGPTAGAAESTVKKRDAAVPATPGLTELVTGIGELTRVVKRQEEELARLRQARGVSNAIPVDGGGRRAEPQDVSWPLDMNRPISRDKVKKEVSFFDE
jgi:hypothetical protein